MTPDDGLAAAVAALAPPWHGYFVSEVDSTQDEARRLVRVQAAPSGTVIVADVQRAGRGRQGRTWSAPRGSSLLMSVVFRERAATPMPWRWTCTASMALVDAIEAVAPSARPAIKWPNDVMVQDAKVAGILAETSWDGSELIAIVGVGANVTTSQTHLETLDRRATSLSVATGVPIDRAALFTAVVERMRAWSVQPWSRLQAAWSARLWGRGQRLVLQDLGREDEVIVVGVDASGALRVRMMDGTERTTTSAELIA
ncbi:MAG: biotin--[acetyl-CoA-carboxylase] ligase [Chloroflexota bacterium]